MALPRIEKSRTRANKSKTPLAAIEKQKISNAKIKHKVSVMTQFINNGIPYLRDNKGEYIKNDKGHRLLDYFPGSLSAVAKWSTENHCPYNISNIKELSELETFDRNKVSDKSRKGAARLQESLQSLIDKLKERSLLQKDQEKISEIAKLKAENKLLLLQNSALKKSFMEDRKYADEITAKLNELTEDFNNIENELREKIEKLTKENTELSLQSAKLTKTLNKVTPMRKIK